jgi:hypothetical protein
MHEIEPANSVPAKIARPGVISKFGLIIAASTGMQTVMRKEVSTAEAIIKTELAGFLFREMIPSATNTHAQMISQTEILGEWSSDCPKGNQRNIMPTPRAMPRMRYEIPNNFLHQLMNDSNSVG